ncbi:hypothetical protein DOJK_01976 [Patescibacteria group bacterium]|nr:hypothetical protein DOJK_01976 [Patescibacteria group bacterium]
MLNYLIKGLWLIGLCYSVSGFSKSDTVILATDDWQPYIVKGQPQQGEFAKIVIDVFNKIGMKTEFIYAPWKRVESIVNSGQAFAGIPYSYTDERAKTFDYSVPIMDSVYVFLYNKKLYPKGISYRELNELAGYRIGGVTGYWYEGVFKQAGLNVEYVTNDEQGIKKLYAGRIDLAATDQLVGRLLIKKLYPKETELFGEIEQPFAHQCLHLMVSRQYPNAAQLTQKFNSMFQKLYNKDQGCIREVRD